MLVRMVDHYDIYDNNYYIEDDINLCLICHDKDYPQALIKLNNNIYYLKNCNCGGYIHKNCLDMWFRINMSCPYCRTEVKPNISLFKKTTIILYKYLSNCFVFYMINIIKIQGYVFFLYWFYFIFKVNYEILTKKNYNYDNNLLNKTDFIN